MKLNQFYSHINIIILLLYLGTLNAKVHIPTESSVFDSKETVSKWRSLWLNIPDGRHHYTFSLPSMEANKDKTIFIRLKEWKEKEKLVGNMTTVSFR